MGLYSLALLMNAFAMLFGTGVAMRLRTMQAGPLIQMPAFLLLFLAPVWVPYDLLTGWVQAAAAVNPLTLVLDTERGFLVGDPVKVLPAFGVVLLLVPSRCCGRAAASAARSAPPSARLPFAHGGRGARGGGG